MKQDITLNINRTSEDGKTFSSTSINASSLDELQRMLSLAGVKSDISTSTNVPMIPSSTAPESDIEVSHNQNDPINQLPVTDMSYSDAVDYEEQGDLPGDNYDMRAFDRLSNEMEEALHEMDFDYGHNHKNDKENYDEYSHKSASRTGRGNIPVRQINSYGDNPWIMDLNESKIENLAILVEEDNNDDFKSAIKKVIEHDYKLNESEIISLANIFINLLNDKSSKRFNTMQNMVKAITESIAMYKQYKSK
jgi:hypothetical protein